MKETCERRYRLQKNPLDNDELVMNKGSGTLGRRGLKITSGGGVRRQRSLEWRRDRGYSSSEEEFPSRPSVDGHVFASLLAQAQKEYSSGERVYHSDDTEDATTTDNPTTPFPTPPATLTSPLKSPASLSHHRQASPFPHQNTNSRRVHYSTPQERLRATNGDVVFSSSSNKKSNISGNSGNNSRNHRSHHGRKCGMTSSSSATSCNSCVDNGRIDNDENEESPPEPAPPEIPPRGPSLHPGTLRRRGEYSLPLGEAQNAEHQEAQFITQGEYVLNGNSPRTAGYPARSPMPSNVNSQHRLPPGLQQTQITQQLSNSGGGNTMQNNSHCQQPQAPLVMPVFPLRPPVAPSHVSSHYSPYSPSRFHIDKQCHHRCTWKCFSIALILIAVILTGILAYFAAISSAKPSMDASNCILVQDVKDVTNDQITQGSISSQLPTEESLATSTAEHSSVTTNVALQQQPQHQSQSQQPQSQPQPQPQWPPLLELRDYDVPHTTTIPPYQFWNTEFRNKQPAFIRFNFTLPWGANFAVYGRRNVAPSITQYDFVEFVKGGRIDHRLKKRDLAATDNEQRRIKSNFKINDRNSKEILDSISSSYEATRKILSDSDNSRMPISLSKSIRLNVSQTEPTDIPRPTIDLGLHLDSHIISKRETELETMMVNVSLLQYLDSGRWFLSVYNDELRPHIVSLVITEAEDVTTTCPNDCSGRGSCYLGKCECIDGFQGIDCSKSVCPVLCSAHGQYGGGICHCEEGWKGPECDVPETECRVPGCSGNGLCVTGSCQCKKGWKGDVCDEPDCEDPTCSNHGACVHGQCYCKAGWKGALCHLIDEQVHKCLPSCSDHGVYDLESAKCVCNRHWTGSDCSQAVCNLDCGPNGICDSGKCQCNPGWTGSRCDLLPCDPRCQEHGQCRNGTCVCSQGWNGKHCTLPGCENGCSGHGQCTLEEGLYLCVCIKGWAGSDCSIPLETDCYDGIDNDHDGMADCFDSECCSHSNCSDHIMCLASNDPVEVLLRKQPPSVTASFYQRVKFLIEENSVQSYAHLDEYTESRVAVMRGQVVTPQGLGIVGIRVSVDKESRLGFTLTRQGGWFDVLVNGGGAVTLQFQRSPFRPLIRTVFVPWNQIVVLPPVHMELMEDAKVPHIHTSFLARNPAIMFQGVSKPFFNFNGDVPQICKDHNLEFLKPIIIGTWIPEAVGGFPGKSIIFAENQVVQESISIPGSDLHLMYRSSQSSGYLSTIHMKLTGPTIPKTLTHIFVRVEVEGSLHAKTYEADPNLTHIFAWNKRNVYKQKVYGLAQAKVSIGYQHSTCAEPVWETQSTALQGFEVDISDIGGWGLDIHHHYNFHEGILQKGDGSTLHLKQYPRLVEVLMGTGNQRTLECPGQCGGAAKDAKLLTPVALASGPDGSLYVGDFNLVRRINPEGSVYTVLQLRATQVSYQYYLAVSPADGRLYISDPEKHQVLRIITLDPTADPTVNSEPVVGSGERCIPGDESQCGDEGPAKHARLAHPKGIAIAADKTMYLADGTNIRAVDPRGIIHTLVGNHGYQNQWMPTPCSGAVLASQAQLQWPTGLALSPLDGALHIIDDRLILKITQDMKIEVVAGIPLHCRSSDNSSIGFEQEGILGTISSLSFAPNGDLYISESDTHKGNLIKIVHSSGQVTHFAGILNNKIDEGCTCNFSRSVKKLKISSSNCPCANNDNNLNNGKTLLSNYAKFQSVSAVAVSPDGVINIADQGSLRILTLKHYLPNHDENGEFCIPYPSEGEVYVFNRYGQHVATKDLTSGKTRYSFLYSKNTSFGKLSTVTDSSGNKIQFLRDYSNAVSSIENTQDHKSELKISGIGYLEKLSIKGRSEIQLDYDMNTGLLVSRSGGGETCIYQYDWMGRVIDVILPSGEVYNLRSSLSGSEGLETLVNKPPVNLIYNDKFKKHVSILNGLELTKATVYKNSSLVINTAWNGEVHVSAIAKHPLLEKDLPIEAQMLPIWSDQISIFGDEIINHQYIKYSLVGDSKLPQKTLRSDIFVNDSRVFAIEFDQFSSKETFFDYNGYLLLSITFDPAGLPQSYIPAKNSIPLNISYDGFNRVDGWKWGRSELKYSYDRHGLLSEITSSQDGTQMFTYNDWNMLSKISLASQRNFLLTYDEDGGLRFVTLPSGTKHIFSLQPSLGFLRATYTPPGSNKSYLQHFSHSGQLLQTVFPGDGARIVYRYTPSGKLKEVVRGDGKTTFKYSPETGLPVQVANQEPELEYHWDYQYTGGLLTEERLSFTAKSGLSNAKFTYEYDGNYRLISVQGRIGGQNLPLYNLGYNSKTGALETIGPFRVDNPTINQTNVYDGTALFSRKTDTHFLERQIALTIHGMEVFRMEFNHDIHGRISQTRTYTKNVGVNTYTNIKNFTWDCDGQLSGVEAQEPWGFRYDDNGNMLSLTYRGNTIPMEYNTVDRIIKFGEGQYKYDNRGSVIQNAREEKFHYNAKGLLVRATKRGRFDVKYFYDHVDRLITRKDNYGNVTQFFYNNQENPGEVTQIYSPRDGKLISLVYDDRGHLVYAQVYRHKYYIATDQCGTPVMIFNQYGEGIREIMRSPYGHIVYDSNPYLYLPVDFCGGILDQVTSLVHMPNGKVYDPLIGQWMSPIWENVLDRVATPTHLHLYRFNGNDPINIRHDRSPPKDHLSWLKRMGYDFKNLAPQLYPDDLPGGHIPPLISEPTVFWNNIRNSISSQLTRHPSPNNVESGIMVHINSRRMIDSKTLHVPPKSVLKTDVMNLVPNKIGAASDPPFGKGILISRSSEGRAIVSSVPAANAIYRDVYTSVFNRSFLLPFTFVVHSAQQDAFYFVKEDTWKVNDDNGQLKRLQGQVNTTFHEIAKENGSGNNYFDVKIHGLTTVINLRYGTTMEKEKQRLLHHAKLQAIKKAWHKEKETIKNGFQGSTDWSANDLEELLKNGNVAAYEAEYIHSINDYPELAEDPYNVRFFKRQVDKRRKKRTTAENNTNKSWWFPWQKILC